MNKITPHQLRDLSSTLPAGTECYLCNSVRKALSRYRKGEPSSSFVSKEQAVKLLEKHLGRGLSRFLVDEIRSLLPTKPACTPEKLA